MSLRQKLLLFVIPGMLILFGGLYYAVSIVVEHEERSASETYAQRHLLVVLGLQKERSAYLGDKAEHIASLPIFKAALAEGDPEQIKTVTDNLLKLPDSALLMVSDDNSHTRYQQLGDTSITLEAKDIPTIACAIKNRHVCRNVLRIGRNVFNVTSTPVSSGPKMWGVLTTGFVYSDSFLTNLRESTEYCEITFVDNQCSILASTLARRDFKAVRNQCLTSGLGGLGEHGDDVTAHDLDLGNHEYISFAGAIADSGNKEVAYLIVHQSLQGMDDILEQVHKYFLLVGGVLLILLIIGDMLVVRGAVKPIEELEMATGKINVGDSKLEMKEVTSSREARHLQQAINGMLHDINIKTQTLRHSEVRYRQMIDHSQKAIISADSDMNIIIWNAAAETVFGYSESEILGKPVNTIVPACYQAEHHPMSEAPSDCGMLYKKSRLRTGIHKSGRKVPIEISLSHSRDTDGKMIFTTFIRDITSDLEAEAQQRMLINAIEQSTDMIVITDTQANILYANPAFEATTGHIVDEIIGKSTRILKSGKQPAAFYQELWDTISSGHVWKGTLTNKRKNGERYPEEMTISPVIDTEGSIQQYIAIKRDISTQEKLKAQVEHTQRLESLGVLAGGIAHDFNNILSAIMGNASLAERKMEANAPARKYLETILTSSERAANLCKQMLAYSGKGKFVIKPIDLSVLVRDMSNLLEVSIGKNIMIDYHLNQQLPAIDADEAQIQQVVMNLITNASEAIGSDNNGVISITTGVMQADEAYMHDVCLGTEAMPGHCVYLEVSDNGCGMDTATKNKIFDPFFTTKFTGRGLGMSAVLGIIRGHHASMKLFSQPGSGAHFKITFPMLAAPIKNNPQVRLEKDIKGSGTILIVDDEQTLREVAVSILADSGFDTMTACDGQECVEIYQHHADKIDCLLLDMTMPRMNGEEVFHAVRAINPEVKVILCSGYSVEDATRNLAGKELNGFIQKPYMPDTLIETLNNVLNT